MGEHRHPRNGRHHDSVRVTWPSLTHSRNSATKDEPPRCIQHRDGSKHQHTYIMPTPTQTIPTLTEKEKSRFWSKVEKLGNESGCWLWTGYSDSAGYGNFQLLKLPRKAHRVAFVLSGRELMEGMCVLHKCDTPGCVNPAHLRAGTHRENSKDMVSKGRQARGETHMSRTKPEALLRGVKNPRAILDDATVHKIRARFAKGEAISVLCEELGVSHGCISSIVHGRSWKHLVA